MDLNPENLNSSYRKNNYGEVFEAIAFLAKQPVYSVEFGVLEGYSAFHLNKYSKKLILCDLFEDCKFKHAQRDDISTKFPNAVIDKIDFYEPDAWAKIYKHAGCGGPELLHIDIANTGDTYRHFMKAYYPRLALGSVTILEGGSEERDGYWWMKAFNKPPIREALEEFKQAGIQFHVIEAFPSLTIVRK